MTDKRQTVTVRLPLKAYGWLRQYAFDQHTTQQRVMEDALDEYRRRIAEKGPS